MEKRILNKNIDLLLSGFTELKDNGRFNEPNLDGSIGDYIPFASWEWPQGVGLFGLVRLTAHGTPCSTILTSIPKFLPPPVLAMAY
ncbi:glycoside hydrolase family 88 protein [Dickeya oryzae]|uniref:glycoside hydrolase family 88 protein n=1 Tax=Dickeya oryzae TaxID=1240404 RepID=UPI001FEDEE85|nr:glycoside hydrolase family 88 protein [Dickeya oryzae]